MKSLIWAKTLFESYKYLGRIIKSIDKLVLDKSINSGNIYQGEGDTMDRMQAVIDLIQRKRRLLTIKLVIEESIKNCNEYDSNLLVKYYIDKIDVATIAAQLDSNKRTIHRHINNAAVNAMEHIYVLGYSLNDIEQMLENEGWIAGIYNSFIVKMNGIEKGMEPLIIPKMNRIEQLVSRMVNRA